MDFGHVDDLKGLKLSLPADAPHTAAVLAAAPKQTPTVYVGCPSYNHPEWRGRIYSSTKDLLAQYTAQVNSLEANSTAYAMPTPKLVAQWRAAATHGFVYCPKLPQNITHWGKLTEKAKETAEYAEVMRGLRPHLGHSLLQFSDRFGPKRLAELADYLQAFPKDIPLAIELRHPDWYATAAGQTIFDLMQQLGHCTVITDTAGRRDVVHMRLTAPVAFVRFTGNDLHPTDYQRMDDWVQRIAHWLGQGLHTLYFFVHSTNKTNCPELVNYMIAALNKHTGLQLQPWVAPAISGKPKRGRAQ